MQILGRYLLQQKKRLFPSQILVNHYCLENELNIKIYSRTRIGAHLTEAGKVIIEKAKIILKHINDLNKIAQVENTSLKGNLTLLQFLLLGNFFTKTLSIFKSQYPDVQIEV